MRVKLRYLNQWNTVRRRNAALYTKHLKPLGIATPIEAPYTRHVYHVYAIRVKERDAMRMYLAKQGVATGIHYPLPIHLQPAYRDLGHHRGDFPVSEQLSKEVLSLPMHPFLTEEKIRYVCRVIERFYQGVR